MPFGRFRTSFALLLPLVLAITLSCSDSTGPGGPRIALGTTVSGELASASEADTFSVGLTRLQQIVAILEPLDGEFVLSVHEPGGRRVSQVTGDSDVLDAHGFATGLVRVEMTGTYLIRVAAAPGTSGGTYRMRVVASVGGPETASPNFAVRDTVHELLEHRQDADEFIVDAAPGTDVTIHARVPGAAAGAVQLIGYVQGGDGFVIGLSAAGNAEIDSGQPITVRAQSTGRVVFRVEPTGIGRAITRYPVAYEITARQ